MNKVKRTVFIVCGSVSLALGVVGVFVPGLPTTPFVLLSSYLFYHSSDRLHQALRRSRMGKYIERYEKREGMSWSAKGVSLLLMWLMVTVSAFLFFETAVARIILYSLAVVGTCCVVFVVPNAKKE